MPRIGGMKAPAVFEDRRLLYAMYDAERQAGVAEEMACLLADKLESCASQITDLESALGKHGDKLDELRVVIEALARAMEESNEKR